jgi:CRISPR/Cas system-associated exonuclease Cas4 (RecB family)
VKLSATKINKFLRCQRSYEDHYLRGNKGEPTQALTLGSICHQAVALGFEFKKDSGKDIDLEEKFKLIDELFDEDRERGTTHYTDSFENVVREAKELVMVHDQDISRKVKPFLIERPFSVNVGDHTLVGVWDLITEDSWIVDYKTYKKTPSQSELDKDLQLGLYSLAYRLEFGEIEKGLRLDCSVKTRVKKTAQLCTSRTNEELEWLIKFIDQVAQQMEAGVYVPNNTGWWCSPQYCSAWDSCQFGGYK